MAKPAISGPSEPEVEKPSASQLKLVARSSAPPIAPTTWLTATWNTMKPVPISALAKYSVSSRGERKGSRVPKASTAEPNSIGRRAPMRSIRRPAMTANSIGSSAYTDISAPTISGVACRWMAYSDIATRLPLKAM